MDSDNQLVIYCVDDGENTLYCDIYDKLCIERFYKNHLKSQTHINNIRKRESSINFISTLTEPKH